MGEEAMRNPGKRDRFPEVQENGHSNPQKNGALSITRRTFLKGAALAGAGVLAGPEIISSAATIPPSAKIRERIVSTSCLNCPASCAIRVRIVNGKAVSIGGNYLSQVSGGKTCPRAHIGLQVLYDPSRIQTPMKRTRREKGKNIDPQWAPLTWDQAFQEITDRLRSLRDQGRPHQLLLLHGLNPTSDIDLIRRFGEAYGTPNVISGEGLENEAEKAGRWMADGNYRSIAYDLERTHYLLAFGASILESHKPLARNLRLWGKVRRESALRTRVVVIDPRYSVTASKADEWIPIHPGTDGALAMGIARVILSEELYDKNFIRHWTAGFPEYAELAISQYPPEKVARITGIAPEQIQRIAREFARTKPAIAWVGTGPSRWPNGSYNAYAIFCLNALVGSIDAPGGVIYQENPGFRDMPKVIRDGTAQKGLEQARLDLGWSERFPVAEVATNRVANSIAEGVPYRVEVVVGWNCNFPMSAPAAWKWDEALRQVPYYVHVAPFPSEMAAYADLLLPSATFLEQWGYDEGPPASGFAEARLKQPVIDPLPHSKSPGEIIFQLAQLQGGAVAQSFSNLGGEIQAFIRYRTETLLPWKDFCEKGVWVGPAYQYHKYDRVLLTSSKKFEFYAENLEKAFRAQGKKNQERFHFSPHYEEVRFIGDPKKYPLVLLTYQPLLRMENGSQNYPWAQEPFLVMHGVGWTNFAEMNSQTAKTLGIRDGDMVWVESAVGRIKVKARVFEGLHPQVLSMARGQGHWAGGPWAKRMGANPQEIIGEDYDPLSGQAVFYNTRVKVHKV